MIGKSFSHYRILEPLGKGGMGVVYKAEDTTLKRTVALKFLAQPSFAGDEEKDRFIREAQAAAALDHVNICTVYEVDETDDGQIFIAMAYYEGETLKERIARGPLPVNEAIDLAIQVCRGLKKAHELGVVHRDIKPANIIITSDGVVKILDFGLAKLAGRPKLTKTGSTMGTAAYMSPEQSLGGFVDHRADLWSLGVMLYEMVAGCTPFRGEYEHAILYSIMNEDPEPVTEIRSDVPRELERVITRTIQKEPEDRYSEVDELLSDLQSLREGVTTSIRPRAGKSKARRPFGKPLYAAIAGLLVLSMIAVLYLTQGGKETTVQTSIAVMPFTIANAQNDWTWLRVGMADLLSTDLAQIPSLRVLDTQRQMRTMRSLGIRGAELTQEEALAVARKAKVHTVFLGELEITEDKVGVRVRLLDAKSGMTMAELPRLEGRISALYDLVDKVASQVGTVLDLGSSVPQQPLKGSALVASSLDAQRYYLEGLDAAYDMRHRESIGKLRRAIALDSTFVKPYYYLAWQYRTTGDYANAKKILAKGKPYIRHLSDEARLQYLSNEASIDHRWRDLATYSKRLLKIDPASASEWYRYGWVIYHKFRELDDGIAAIEKALALDSTYAIAYNTLAFAYLAKGEVEKSLRVIKKGMSIDLTDVNTRDSQAEILVLTGRYREAIENCERILELNPDFNYTPLHLVKAYLRQGRYSRASAVAEGYTAQATTPFFQSRGYMYQAYSRWYQHDDEKALELLDQALERDSTNLEARWLTGLIYVQRNAPESAADALASLQRALGRREGLDGHWFLHHLRGKIAQLRGDYDEAIRSFDKALSLYPLDRTLYLVALADAYAKAGRNAEAVQTYRAALEFNPQYAQAAFGLAQAYDRLGKAKEARLAYDRVVAIWAEADSGIIELQTARRNSSSRQVHNN
jgi:serine/threonine-protein kinase